jgi:hypothetical protein
MPFDGEGGDLSRMYSGAAEGGVWMKVEEWKEEGESRKKKVSKKRGRERNEEDLPR